MYLLIAVPIVFVIIAISAARASTPGGKARAARTCTKHMIAHQVPGGGDRLVGVIGQHRTKGNRCDGTEHKRAPLGGWW